MTSHILENFPVGLSTMTRFISFFWKKDINSLKDEKQLLDLSAEDNFPVGLLVQWPSSFRFFLRRISVLRKTKNNYWTCLQRTFTVLNNIKLIYLNRLFL